MYGVFSNIQCFDGYTLLFRIYGVVLVILFIPGYHVCSRIYSLFTDKS